MHGGAGLGRDRSGCPWPLSWPAAEWPGAAATAPAAAAAAAAAASGGPGGGVLPAVSPNTPAAAAVSPTPPAPPAAPTLAWLPALERLEVCLQISAVTVTVPAGPESGGGAAGDAERTADPLPAAAGHHPAPVPGRVRSSSDSGHRYCLHGQLVSVLPSVRLDSAALKSAALPTVPEVPVRLTRSSAAAAGSQLRLPSQTQQVMSPSVLVRDCAPIPRPTPPPPPPTTRAVAPAERRLLPGPPS
ncbi:transcription initiation factor TFIID subunit 4-like [Amphibalanus amphitrite]|uniref:transcription initiation factor TFIID subunit 4-like n=1 Tax=Amphibalanus amphitrite TaxID=1232801 RepID=UPI001C919B0D|nr:transcription initiation factor TFIID subunit 4-like [Amphibalanus amphitrite]